MAEMKTLNGNEIVDAAARKRLDKIEEEGGWVIVEVGYDASTDVATASHSASEIFALVQGGASVVAVVNGKDRYPYKRATINIDGDVTLVEFSFTEVGEQLDAVTTYGINIDENKDCTFWRNEFVGGGVTPIFEIGGVETLEAGESAYVNVDTTDPTAPIISFGIPKGGDGQPGAPGQEGKSAYQLWLEGGGSGTMDDFLASLKGVDGTTQVTPLYAESLDWLEANGEKDKLYVLPDGFIYGYFESESTQLYVNRLLEADTTTRITGDASTAGQNGYVSGVRLNSSGLLKESAGYSSTGFIPYGYQGAEDIIRIKNAACASGSSQQELCFYDSEHKFLGYAAFGGTGTTWEGLLNDEANNTVGWKVEKDGDGEYTLSWMPSKTNAIKNGTVDTSKIAYIRISLADFANAIITVNQEIIEGGTEGGLGWNNTGHAFVPANYEPRIIALEQRLDAIAPTSGNIDLEYIRNWDAPIYDANIPVFEITSEKAAIKDSERNPTSLYAKYDALMAQYPRYITKKDLGLCSDGVNHLYQYDFKTPKTDSTGSMFSEKKPKAILMSGIHQEPGGAFGLFYALEEIVSNPALRHFLNNVHLIVIPCANPYAFDTADIHNVYLNANGVEIHRNFEVAFVNYETEGDDQYSGATPLSEIESQVIDNVMKANQDAAFVLSCHTFNNSSGKDVMWGSCGTLYTCNLVCRLIQKMSISFLNRFADEFTGIDEDNPTMGWVSVSGTGGSEYRQATKYGIQGFNLEVSETFAPHSPTKRTAFAMTRYAEVYLNMLLTAFGVYDYKDKDKYCKYLRG